MKHREIIKLLEAKDGASPERAEVTLSASMKHKPGIIVVPIHTRDLAKGTAAAILKQAGIGK